MLAMTDYIVAITDRRNDYACRIINALRDYEAEHGNNIDPMPHLKAEDMYTLGCYATSRGVLLGGLLYSIHREWIFLSSGFVWPEHRGRGIYSAIMREIEGYAMKKRCNGIFVSTYTFEAPHIYEHWGFTKGSVLPDMPRGNTSIDYFKLLR